VHASCCEKGRLLYELCSISCHSGKHALALLSFSPAAQPVSAGSARPPSYEPDQMALLRVCWAAPDGIGSKLQARFS